MRVPAELARITLQREGDPGARWIAELPGIVASLVDGWGLRIDGEPRHGQVALVVPVQRGEQSAVLKVSFPHEGNRSEAGALRVFGGGATVRLLDADEERFALLLERAGDRTPEELDPDAWVELAADLARELAVPAGPAAPVLADTADGWDEQLDRQLAAVPTNTVPARAVVRARAAIRAIAADRSTTLIHGDLHARNVLSSTRRPWLAIDPKGFRGPIAWDALTVCATPVARLVAQPDPVRELRRRLRTFAGATGTDTAQAIEVAYARTLSSLLHETLGGGKVFGRRLLSELVVEGL